MSQFCTEKNIPFDAEGKLFYTDDLHLASFFFIIIFFLREGQRFFKTTPSSLGINIAIYDVIFFSCL